MSYPFIPLARTSASSTSNTLGGRVGTHERCALADGPTLADEAVQLGEVVLMNGAHAGSGLAEDSHLATGFERGEGGLEEPRDRGGAAVQHRRANDDPIDVWVCRQSSTLRYCMQPSMDKQALTRQHLVLHLPAPRSRLHPPGGRLRLARPTLQTPFLAFGNAPTNPPYKCT